MSELTTVLLYASTVTPLPRVGGAPQSTLLAGEQESGHWVILHVSVYIRTEY